jgi:hypothetical protein
MPAYFGIYAFFEGSGLGFKDFKVSICQHIDSFFHEKKKNTIIISKSFKGGNMSAY